MVFYMQVYRDAELAAAALGHLRTHYPLSRVILRSDGDDDPVFGAIARAYHTEYMQDNRLYSCDRGGAMIERMLRLFLERPGDFLMKIDTDTRIDRPLSRMPQDDDGIYGTLVSGLIQGGCVLFTRAAANRLLASDILRSPELCSSDATWAPATVRPLLAERAAHSGLLSFDWMLHWACLKTGIRMHDHPEIKSEWLHCADNRSRRFSVVHPDKFMHLPPGALRLYATSFHERLINLYAQAIAGFVPVTRLEPGSTP